MNKENETPEVTDKTYTLNSENCVSSPTCVDLMILLPQDATENPYEFTAFDVSQTIDNSHQNAIFLYMKKKSDDGEDLSGYDDDKTDHLFSVDLASIIQLNNQENYSAYDINSKKDTLVVVYHDTDDTANYKQTCAEKLFLEVSNVRTQVVVNGNFQTSMTLMGTGPKKAGMSSFPRK